MRHIKNKYRKERKLLRSGIPVANESGEEDYYEEEDEEMEEQKKSPPARRRASNRKRRKPKRSIEESDEVSITYSS